MKKHPYNTKNNAANYIEKFNIPTVLMAMFIAKTPCDYKAGA
jgi:hypothetical protein